MTHPSIFPAPSAAVVSMLEYAARRLDRNFCPEFLARCEADGKALLASIAEGELAFAPENSLRALPPLSAKGRAALRALLESDGDNAGSGSPA